MVVTTSFTHLSILAAAAPTVGVRFVKLKSNNFFWKQNLQDEHLVLLSPVLQ
jgi:hypothetical protein